METRLRRDAVYKRGAYRPLEGLESALSCILEILEKPSTIYSSSRLVPRTEASNFTTLSSQRLISSNNVSPFDSYSSLDHQFVDSLARYASEIYPPHFDLAQS